jgi:hypothetical protein
MEHHVDEEMYAASVTAYDDTQILIMRRSTLRNQTQSRLLRLPAELRNKFINSLLAELNYITQPLHMAQKVTFADFDP